MLSNAPPTSRVDNPDIQVKYAPEEGHGVTDGERDQREPDDEQEGFGWFGVPPGPVVNREEMEAAMAGIPADEDMDAVERRMYEDWLKRQERELGGTADAPR